MIYYLIYFTEWSVGMVHEQPKYGYKIIQLVIVLLSSCLDSPVYFSMLCNAGN